MTEKKFNPNKMQKLNNPDRLIDLPPDFMFSKAGITDPQTILDIGAGTGFYSIQLVKYFKNCKVIACDIAEVMLDWINENVVNNYPEISTLLMTENQIPVQDNIGDMVMMLNLHHELEEPDKMLTECKRILKPGGRILISDWKKEEMPMGPPLEIRCDPEDVAEQLKTCGYKNVKTYNDLKNNFVVVGEMINP